MAASGSLSLLHGSLLFAPSWRTVVRIAHDDHPAGDASLPPPVDPQIVDVVEVDVRQQRADDSALRRPLLRLDQLVFFENPCCQPLADQSYDPAIADAVLDKTDQPILVDRVEERLDIGIEDPVDPPLPDSERERPAPVTRPPGSESGPCFAVPPSPWPRPFAPQAPPRP